MRQQAYSPWHGTTVLAALLCVVACQSTNPGTALADEPAPRKIADFSLADARGAHHKLSELGDAKLVVVAFLGTQCPLARLYGPRLTELQQEFAKQGVAWIGVVSNSQDSAEDVAAYARECGVDFSLLLDPAASVADQFAAQRTPEVFLLDQDRVVRYHGRIDDQYSIGLKRPQVGQRDLATAIGELLADKPVSQTHTPAVGCLIGRAKKPATDTSVTYAKHIAPLLQERCVICHRPGEVAPFSVTNFQEVVGWADTIVEVVDAGRMPPWFASPDHGKFANDVRMSEAEKDLIRTWVRNGCPQGDLADLPKPREFPLGWNIPQPDVVIATSTEPEKIPADGVIPYKYFTVDPGFTEDKWMSASEVRPGNPGIVHHVLVYVIPPGGQPERQIVSGQLVGAYAPGSPPRAARPGMAMKIAAGSKILFQMHYTPNGKPQEDITTMGLKFCPPSQVTQEVISGWAINFAFAIPPGADDYPVTSSYKFREDRMLLSLTPHMHLRGKTFRYEARYPDGTREVLLEVPKWDFNWQIDYALAEPKLLPKGTVLACSATFDNSPNNPANPDPTDRVTFGEQTWDEMMIGWFVTASLPKPVEQAKR